MIGWDLDSRTRLVGESGRADDGYPEQFIELISALVGERPQLRVFLLVWDYSLLYAFEREPFSMTALRWRSPRRIRYCRDDDLPAGGVCLYLAIKFGATSLAPNRRIFANIR